MQIQYILKSYNYKSVMDIISVIWLVFYNKAVSVAKNEREKEDAVEETKIEVPVQKNQEKGEKR